MKETLIAVKKSIVNGFIKNEYAGLIQERLKFQKILKDIDNEIENKEIKYAHILFGAQYGR